MELFEGWRTQPPMRDLVEVIARWVGWKPPAMPIAPASAADNEASIAAVMRQFPDGRVR